jgi:hypothetical protein
MENAVAGHAMWDFGVGPGLVRMAKDVIMHKRGIGADAPIQTGCHWKTCNTWPSTLTRVQHGSITARREVTRNIVERISI